MSEITKNYIALQKDIKHQLIEIMAEEKLPRAKLAKAIGVADVTLRVLMVDQLIGIDPILKMEKYIEEYRKGKK